MDSISYSCCRHERIDSVNFATNNSLVEARQPYAHIGEQGG